VSLVNFISAVFSLSFQNSLTSTHFRRIHWLLWSFRNKSEAVVILQFRHGETRPALILGKRFQPGSGPTRLCQPTAVAVASSGHVFVADGYCNHRVLTFNSRGRLMRQIPLPSGKREAPSPAPLLVRQKCPSVRVEPRFKSLN